MRRRRKRLAGPSASLGEPCNLRRAELYVGVPHGALIERFALTYHAAERFGEQPGAACRREDLGE